MELSLTYVVQDGIYLSFNPCSQAVFALPDADTNITGTTWGKLLRWMFYPKREVVLTDRTVGSDCCSYCPKMPPRGNSGVLNGLLGGT